MHSACIREDSKIFFTTLVDSYKSLVLIKRLRSFEAKIGEVFVKEALRRRRSKRASETKNTFLGSYALQQVSNDQRFLCLNALHYTLFIFTTYFVLFIIFIKVHCSLLFGLHASQIIFYD